MIPDQARILLTVKRLGDEYSSKWQEFNLEDAFHEPDCLMLVNTKGNVLQKNKFLVMSFCEEDIRGIYNESRQMIDDCHALIKASKRYEDPAIKERWDRFPTEFKFFVDTVVELVENQNIGKSLRPLTSLTGMTIALRYFERESKSSPVGKYQDAMLRGIDDVLQLNVLRPDDASPTLDAAINNFLPYWHEGLKTGELSEDGKSKLEDLRGVLLFEGITVADEFGLPDYELIEQMKNGFEDEDGNPI